MTALNKQWNYHSLALSHGLMIQRNKQHIKSSRSSKGKTVVTTLYQQTSSWHKRYHVTLVTHWQTLCTGHKINSLGPSDAIWRQKSGSTMAQVMVCCLTAPSHYLNQCWLIISIVLWHSSEVINIRRIEDTNQQSKIEDYIFKTTLRSPKGQWVKHAANNHGSFTPFQPK